MSQHVDFLKSIPKAKDNLPGQWILLGAALVVVLLILGSLALGGYQLIADKQLKLAQKAHQEASAAFQKIAVAYPLFASDTPLVTKVAEFEKLLHDKETHFADLTHTTSRQPFSKYMLALSQTTPDGLWLTSFNINQNSDNISLAGFAIDPTDLTIFLKKLQTAPPFDRETFDLWKMTRIKKNGLHQFEVANNKLLNENQDKTNDKK